MKVGNERKQSRLISEIARDIATDWAQRKGGVHYAAKPYLTAMVLSGSTGIEGSYGLEPMRSVVLYFMSNAGTYKGERARELKAELKAHLNRRKAP